MADAQILRAARARIADPIHWTTGTLARDEQGIVTYPASPKAVCWCAYGAVAVETRGSVGSAGEALRSAAFSLFTTRSVGRVNDVYGHAAVLAMYDAAIASAEASA